MLPNYFSHFTVYRKLRSNWHKKGDAWEVEYDALACIPPLVLGLTNIRRSFDKYTKCDEMPHVQLWAFSRFDLLALYIWQGLHFRNTISPGNTTLPCHVHGDCSNSVDLVQRRSSAKAIAHMPIDLPRCVHRDERWHNRVWRLNLRYYLVHTIHISVSDVEREPPCGIATADNCHSARTLGIL